jgi:outer membrane protein OmpA-like peptidoglycan-associated protein
MYLLRFILLAAAFAVPLSAFSQQNLVRNPSFEEYNHLPAYIGDAPGSIKDWSFAGEGGSGDYFHTNAIGMKCRTTGNYFGSETPHSGIAYAGFCVTPVYREFLCSQLITPLEKGKKYRFTMYVSKGDSADVSYLKEITVLFLSRQYELPFGVQMGLPPQIVFYQDTGFTQQNGWQQLTAEYTARGTEKWLYIGSSEWKCDTCKSLPGTPRAENPGIFGATSHEAHYYVDDVSIVEVNDVPAPGFEAGKTYAFNNIHFATNSAVLESGEQPDLEAIAAHLLGHPEINVAVTGHTDSIGDSRSNYVLSLNRAEAVKDYFIARGIAADRITTAGAGETKFVAPNNTEEGRALNRRVEFLFSRGG